MLMTLKLGCRGGVAPTLNAMDNSGDSFATVLILGIDFYNATIDERNFHTLRSGGANEGRPGVLIIDGTRVDDVRVYEDGIVPTVISRWGTGGGNVPMVFPIQDGRDIEKNQNGLGVGNEDSSAYKLDRTGGQAAAVDFYNASLSETSQTIRSHTATAVNIGGIMTNSTVRRLTPMECERLQGFPDGWTEGQADTHRYKQMGNAVAVPVVSWLVNRLMEASHDMD